MAPASATVEVSLTEVPAYRRLVTFLQDIESLGRVNADEEIQGLVEECHADLVREASS